MKGTQQMGGLRAERSLEQLSLTPRVCHLALAVATAPRPSLVLRQKALLDIQSFLKLRNT